MTALLLPPPLLPIAAVVAAACDAAATAAAAAASGYSLKMPRRSNQQSQALLLAQTSSCLPRWSVASAGGLSAQVQLQGVADLAILLLLICRQHYDLSNWHHGPEPPAGQP